MNVKHIKCHVVESAVQSEGKSPYATFRDNLRKQMVLNRKSRRDVCNDLGIGYSTFTTWYNGKSYPRIGKIELLANYFGISKSELIADKPGNGFDSPKEDYRQKHRVSSWDGTGRR